MDVFKIPLGYVLLTTEKGNTLPDEHGNNVSLPGSFKRLVEEIVDGVKVVIEKTKKMIDVFFQFLSGGGE